jgi:hypothetical protein
MDKLKPTGVDLIKLFCANFLTLIYKIDIFITML